MRKTPEDEKIFHTLTVTLNNGQFIRTETKQRNQGIDAMTHVNLTNTCKTFQPNTEEYTFFPEPHGAFSKINHILGTQNKYQQMKKIAFYQITHHVLKLELNSNTNYTKSTKSWKLNNSQLNHQGSRKK